jgi:hypothetical protein
MTLTNIAFAAVGVFVILSLADILLQAIKRSGKRAERETTPLTSVVERLGRKSLAGRVAWCANCDCNQELAQDSSGGIICSACGSQYWAFPMDTRRGPILLGKFKPEEEIIELEKLFELKAPDRVTVFDSKSAFRDFAKEQIKQKRAKRANGWDDLTVEPRPRKRPETGAA